MYVRVRISFFVKVGYLGNDNLVRVRLSRILLGWMINVGLELE